MRVENSFLPVHGVGERTERALWSAGVTHWEDFSGQVVGPTLTERIEDYIAELWPAVRRGELDRVAADLPSRSRWRLLETAGERTCYLDIETTGLDPSTSRVTTVSVHVDGRTRTLVADREPLADELAAILEDASLLVTFNGARFDLPFLQQHYDLPDPPPHLDLLYPCRRVGLEGGLTSVEDQLGIERTVTGVDGRDAVRLWRRYERGDEDALATLIEYNREDTETLTAVARSVCDALHETVFSAARP